MADFEEQRALLVSHRVEREQARADALVAAEAARIADERLDRKSTRLNSSHLARSRMPSSA